MVVQVGCSIRAFWILNNLDNVVFSRRFPVVERQWRLACKILDNSCAESSAFGILPSDLLLAAAFSERKKREGSVHGYGIRVAQSTKGMDSWVDDPILRHIISLDIGESESGNHIIWPLVMHHMQGSYCILVLPLLEPRYLNLYSRFRQTSNCGISISEDESLSSILVDLPSVTGAFMVAHAIGDIIMRDILDHDTLAKSASSSAVPSNCAANSMMNFIPSGSSKISSRPLEKDTLRSFICSVMPFGTPLALDNCNVLKAGSFYSLDLPSSDAKQPGWKPYLYRGKQRMSFTVQETVHAAMYDCYDVHDVISVSGHISCVAELEGLPDVSVLLTGLDRARVEALSLNPCAHVAEQDGDKQTLMFSPPLGKFVLARYEASCAPPVPPVNGFYQLSLVSENEGVFLFKLLVMDGYKAPMSMEFCNVIMPFPRRKISTLDGSPSVGSVSTTDHSVEWKLLASGRSLSGRSIEATFTGTVKFAPVQIQKSSSTTYSSATVLDEGDGVVNEIAGRTTNAEDLMDMDKMSDDLPSVELEEPFCWQAYNYAKVSFRIIGASISGMSIDPKSVGIYPATRAPVDLSAQVTSGEYILWNTLGKCPTEKP